MGKEKIQEERQKENKPQKSIPNYIRIGDTS